MDWMETTAERRAHPRAMWPDARSAIVLGVNYGPDHDPLAALERPDRAARSRSTPRATTITTLIKKRLKALAPLAGGASSAAS